MYDIFLSYATSDRARLTPLYQALCAQGWSVFWDHRVIGGGEDWSDEIETAVYESHCMVVVWSHGSLEAKGHGAHTRYAIRSKWVKKEASAAEDRAVLIPICLDDVPPPFLFKEYQTIDFKDWNQQPNHAPFTKLSQQIQTHLTRHAEQQAAELLKQQLDALAKDLAAQRETLTLRKTELDRQQAEWAADDKVLKQQEAELARQQAARHIPTPAMQPSPKILTQPTHTEIQTPPPKVIQAVTRLPFEPEMVGILAGSFTMGWVKDRDGEEISYAKPAHIVNLRHFEIGKYPVTQAQWQAVMGDNPSYFKDGGDTCPVELVSWEEVQLFIQNLNALTGKTYRLPSEAEWEYACRAGMNHRYSGSNNIEQAAWYDGNSGGKTHPVGQKQANAFGLYDMSGNVWEWVQDSWHGNYEGAPSGGSAWEDSGTYRVLRGGSWYRNPLSSRAANRDGDSPAVRNGSIGFRLARTLP
jgi:formylglycine-generating enzyme required for sulfatase activity